MVEAGSASAPKKRKPRREKPPREPPAPPPVASPWAPRALSIVALFFAALFLTLIFADASGFERLASKVPRPLHFFGQIACLFPNADRSVIDYRAEGWVCRDKRWVELDVQRYFPIDAGEKENRFARTMQFYKTERRTMQALDAFIVEHENHDRLEAASHGGGATDLLGGVRFSVLHIPLPGFGDGVARYEKKPISAYPPDVKHDAFWTRRSIRRDRCKAIFPDYDDKDIDDAKPKPEPSSDSKAPAPEDEP